jgi:hypothetical protein
MITIRETKQRINKIIDIQGKQGKKYNTKEDRSSRPYKPHQKTIDDPDQDTSR